MEQVTTHQSAIFEAFTALVNVMAKPALSFSAAAIGLLLLLRLRRYVFNWWVGAFIIAIEAAIIGFGMKDPNFRLIVGKPDNVPITAMLFLSTIVLWISMVQAVNNDRRNDEKLPPYERETSQQKTWVWPDLLYIEFISLIVCSVLLILWAIYLRAPLEQPANPSATPNPSKAPWYFLGLQEMLVYYDPWYAGVVLPTIIIVGLCAIPYIDINPKGSGYYTFTERKMAITVFLFGYLALWVFMIITGTFLRGPGWNFFGPFQFWDPHKVVALNNVNLSDYVWVVGFPKLYHLTGEKIAWLYQGLPDVKNVVPQLIPPDFLSVGWHDSTCRAFMIEVGHACKREFAGLLFLAFYFLAMPGILAKTLLKKLYAQLDFMRYSVTVMLFLTMFTLPLKMVLRWTINLKYFVDTPWIKF
jgi:Cytochrome b(C-terminal)/b6/petD